MMSTRFVLVITVWSYQCLPDFLMWLIAKHKHKLNSKVLMKNPLQLIILTRSYSNS